jgi:hypothetical protein
MSFLSNLLKDVAPVVATVAPFVPGGQAVAIAASAKVAADQRAAAKYQQALQQERINRQMAIGDPMYPGAFPTPRPQNLVASQPGFFERLGGIASNVGSTLLSGLESAVPSVINRAVFGSRPQSAAQGPALTTITNVGAQESQGSGSIQAGAGNLIAPLLSGARNLLKTPQGQIALGGGGALLGSMFGGEAKQMRVTRKMKSQARMVLNMTGGNLAATADMLGIDQNTLIMILLKRFRNDGPVVTKAALRKTKQTIRRLHSMQDVLKSITPTATMRRRAPMKRATTTTLIKN